MKKVIILSALLLASCGMVNSGEAEQEKEKRFLTAYGEGDLVVIKDSQTGCKYLIFEDSTVYGLSAAMTPLLESNGTYDCGD